MLKIINQSQSVWTGSLMNVSSVGLPLTTSRRRKTNGMENGNAPDVVAVLKQKSTVGCSALNWFVDACEVYESESNISVCSNATRVYRQTKFIRAPVGLYKTFLFVCIFGFFAGGGFDRLNSGRITHD